MPVILYLQIDWRGFISLPDFFNLCEVPLEGLSDWSNHLANRKKAPVISLNIKSMHYEKI